MLDLPGDRDKPAAAVARIESGTRPPGGIPRVERRSKGRAAGASGGGPAEQRDAARRSSAKGADKYSARPCPLRSNALPRPALRNVRRAAEHRAREVLGRSGPGARAPVQLVPLRHAPRDALPHDRTVPPRALGGRGRPERRGGVGRSAQTASSASSTGSARGPGQPDRAQVASANNFPTASGLASSASGFAALAGAASQAAGLSLSGRELSQLARFGSGSACRSVFGGFVEWNAGHRPDGRDCFARSVYRTEPLAPTRRPCPPRA